LTLLRCWPPCEHFCHPSRCRDGQFRMLYSAFQQTLLRYCLGGREVLVSGAHHIGVPRTIAFEGVGDKKKDGLLCHPLQLWQVVQSVSIFKQTPAHFADLKCCDLAPFVDLQFIRRCYQSGRIWPSIVRAGMGWLFGMWFYCGFSKNRFFRLSLRSGFCHGWQN
jgi:hypothetical protein